MHPNCLLWVKEQVLNAGFGPEGMWDPASTAVMRQFLSDPHCKAFFVYRRDINTHHLNRFPPLPHLSFLIPLLCNPRSVCHSSVNSPHGSARDSGRSQRRGQQPATPTGGANNISAAPSRNPAALLAASNAASGDDDKQIVAFSIRPPVVVPNELMFFVRTSVEEIVDSNILRVVKFGVIRGPVLESLLRTMQKLYVPMLLNNDSWPDSCVSSASFFCSLYFFFCFIADFCLLARVRHQEGLFVACAPLHGQFDRDCASAQGLNSALRARRSHRRP